MNEFELRGRTPQPPPGPALPPWELGGHVWDFTHPLVMGIVNVTPDSFSDGGDALHPDDAIRRARELWRDGADLIDLGGASSHPAAPQTPVEEELARLLPVMNRIIAEVPLPISIDTQHPEVAEICLKLGAHLINDVSGMRDNGMARLATGHDAPLVIMYNNFTVPKESSALSIVSDMLAFFSDRVAEAEALGVRRLVLDPGYGFGKSLAENLAVLQALPLLRRFGWPILTCTSRKGSLGKLSGEADPKARRGASLASSLFAVLQGANLVRIHDAKDFQQLLRTWRALHGFAGEV